MEEIDSIRADQTLDAPQMHSSCYSLLQKVVGKVTGYNNFTMLRPSASTTTDHVLCIDPCGIAQMIGHKMIPVELLALLIDSGIQLPAPFRQRIIATRQQAGTSRNPAALTNLPANIPSYRMPLLHNNLDATDGSVTSAATMIDGTTDRLPAHRRIHQLLLRYENMTHCTTFRIFL